MITISLFDEEISKLCACINFITDNAKEDNENRYGKSDIGFCLRNVWLPGNGAGDYGYFIELFSGNGFAGNINLNLSESEVNSLVSCFREIVDDATVAGFVNYSQITTLWYNDILEVYKKLKCLILEV